MGRVLSWGGMKVIGIHADREFIHKGLLQVGLLGMKHAPVVYMFECLNRCWKTIIEYH